MDLDFDELDRKFICCGVPILETRNESNALGLAPPRLLYFTLGSKR